VKTLIFDEKVVLTGSVNMTHNGMEHSKEHMFRIADPKVVAEVMADFEKEWLKAEPVSQTRIDEMLTKAKRSQSPQREKSASRSVSRSLSKDLGAEASAVRE
jgi:phosphatidylserine/phosphatidylglycerophosphate/cardiolipin synthase-like enzyme